MVRVIRFSFVNVLGLICLVVATLAFLKTCYGLVEHVGL
jgi:hypothetical protein